MPSLKCFLCVQLVLLSISASLANSAGWEQEWNNVLSAAKKEGRLAVSVHSGEARRLAVLKFQEAYPEIRLEVSTDPTAKYIARIRQEHRAGVYNIDVRVSSPRTNHVLIPERAYVPLRPVLILPEVLDDSKWLGGFSGGYSDREKKYSYSSTAETEGILKVNRDAVPETEFNKIDDLLNPKWRGKIAMADPRIPTAGNSTLMILLRIRGEDFVRRLLMNQRVVFSEDNRLLTDWLVRGRYPISAGLSGTFVEQFKKEGVGLNVKDLMQAEALNLSLSGAAIALPQRPPNPNAAKVFVNWLLSRQGQRIVSELIQTNSRRLDVPVVHPESQVSPEQYRTLFNKDLQENDAIEDQAFRLAREIVK
jgi:iron(III) transport system substrate-binding protein